MQNLSHLKLVLPVFHLYLPVDGLCKYPDGVPTQLLKFNAPVFYVIFASPPTPLGGWHLLVIDFNIFFPLSHPQERVHRDGIYCRAVPLFIYTYTLPPFFFHATAAILMAERRTKLNTSAPHLPFTPAAVKYLLECWQLSKLTWNCV